MSETLDAVSFLTEATKAKASDIFIVAGLPLSYKINGILHQVGERLMPDSTSRLVHEIYELAKPRSIDLLLQRGDDDFSFSIPGLSRYRVSTYKQRGSLAAVIRVITFELPSPMSWASLIRSFSFPTIPKVWFLSPVLPEAGNLPPWRAWWIGSTAQNLTISLPWRIRWNSSTATKKAL